MTKFRAIIAAAGLALLLGSGVAVAAAHSAGTHGNASNQHSAAGAHGAAGSASQGNHGDSNNGVRDHGSSASGSHPTNHGLFVSRAAHDCGHGTSDVHGDCVSAVAKSSQGK
jgi:hypothetical protein